MNINESARITTLGGGQPRAVGSSTDARERASAFVGDELDSHVVYRAMDVVERASGGIADARAERARALEDVFKGKTRTRDAGTGSGVRSIS